MVVATITAPLTPEMIKEGKDPMLDIAIEVVRRMF
jgi:hypothetical protein